MTAMAALIGSPPRSTACSARGRGDTARVGPGRRELREWFEQPVPAPVADAVALVSARDALGQVHERRLEVDLVFLEHGQVVTLVDQPVSEEAVLVHSLVELDDED